MTYTKDKTFVINSNDLQMGIIGDCEMVSEIFSNETTGPSIFTKLQITTSSQVVSIL